MFAPARLLLPLCFAMPLTLQAATCGRESPMQTVALLELYTAAGCSNCQQAERWLTDISERYGAEQVLALALHVETLDQPGGNGRFAQSRFSARQKQLTRPADGGTPKLPAVFVGAREYRGWQNPSDLDQLIRTINGRSAGARISLKMSPAGARAIELQVRFALPSAPGVGRPVEGVVVLYEDRLSSKLRAGENKGATVNHDRVVRYLSAPVLLDAKSGSSEWQQMIELPSDWKRENLGVAAFVQEPDARQVLQAVSMPVCF